MPGFQTILCPTDFSEFSSRALRCAASLAAREKARVILLHVIPGFLPEALVASLRHALPDYGKLLEEDARKRLDQFLEKEGTAAKVQILTRVGEPWKEIIRVARDGRANLVVLGAHGREGWEMALLGSTVSRVLRDAPCPVLTVRHAPGAVSPKDCSV